MGWFDSIKNFGRKALQIGGDVLKKVGSIGSPILRGVSTFGPTVGSALGTFLDAVGIATGNAPLIAAGESVRNFAPVVSGWAGKGADWLDRVNDYGAMAHGIAEKFS